MFGVSYFLPCLLPKSLICPTFSPHSSLPCFHRLHSHPLHTCICPSQHHFLTLPSSFPPTNTALAASPSYSLPATTTNHTTAHTATATLGQGSSTAGLIQIFPPIQSCLRLFPLFSQTAVPSWITPAKWSTNMARLSLCRKQYFSFSFMMTKSPSLRTSNCTPTLHSQ